MVDQRKPALRPMRISLPRDRGGDDGPVPAVPERVPERLMAPDWRSPTEDNGAAAPRADLHIALLAPNREAERFLRGYIRVVKPPLWHGGKILLHVIPINEKKNDVDIKVALAMVDLGLLDAKDLQIGPPDELTIGYPTGLTEDQA